MAKAPHVVCPWHRHPVFAFALFGVACGSSHGGAQLYGDAAAGGRHASGGAEGTGGAKASGGSVATGGGTGSDPSICHASTLSTAPLICPQDWKHVQSKYAMQCIAVGGYQAHCDPYDTLVYHSGTEYTWCYYDTGTGNLIGARSTDDATGKGGTCVAFDAAFTEPALSSCTPASGSCRSP
jgi:hypothetical protein